MLVLDHLSKRFGTRRAVDDVSFSVAAGTVVAVVGENGAGKSTLLSLLSGRLRPDRGMLLLNDRPVSPASPRAALQAGIAAVYQHGALVETFTVAEQLRLAGWRNDTLPLFLRDHVPGDQPVDTLSPAQYQLVEIARALAPGPPRVLLLDEPTSRLSLSQTAALRQQIRDLAATGTIVLVVTHRLPEALAISDRVVVMRGGRVVGDLSATDRQWPPESEHAIRHLMFHQDDRSGTMAVAPPKPTTANAPVLFDVEAATHTNQIWRLAVARGEVLAVIGLDDREHRPLAEFCAGYLAREGAIRFEGKPLPRGRRSSFARRGIAYLTGDRLQEGVVGDGTVAENLLLKHQRRRAFNRRGWLRPRAIATFANRQLDAWNLAAAGPDDRVERLSGGTIQRLIAARELAFDPTLLIARQPTHGIDAATQQVMWQRLRHLAASGAGVLLFTTDIDEVMATAARVMVLSGDSMSASLDVNEATRSRLERMLVSS